MGLHFSKLLLMSSGRERGSLGSFDALRPIAIKQLFEQPLSDGASCQFAVCDVNLIFVAAIAQTISMQKALSETADDKRQNMV
jgi:hypothetical protein